MRLLTVSLSVAACAALGWGQISTTFGLSGGSAHFGSASFFAPRTVAGAPYSAEETNEYIQTLADGTHITRTSPPKKVFRDSLGRTRAERALFDPGMMP